MAAFPSTVKFGWRDLQETPEPVVERAEMERGIPKQRRINSDVRMELELTLHFDTKAELAAFETWFFTTIKGGQDFFDFVHPASGTTVQARAKGGALGPVSWRNRTLQMSQRKLTLEYWRATW
jgi:hypothetical protein